MLASSGRPLEANIVLPALALLSLLRMPIAFLPMIIMQLLNLKVAVGRITKFLMNEELSDEIKARSLEVEASFKEARAQGSPPIALSTAMGEILSETPDTGVAMSSVLRNAADGAAVALDLVSSAFSADVESEESVRIRTMAAPAEEGDITIEGTFGWKKIEVEAGKGKGKGKGGGGRGGGGRGGGNAAPKRSLTSRLTFKVSRSPQSTRKTPDATSTTSTETAAVAAAADTAAEASSPSSKGGRGRGAAAAPPAAEEKATPPTLQRLSISFPRGELTMVAGAVGCGKSSLLCALLGELRAVADADAGADAEGRLDVSIVRRSPGAVGYFAQTPFILNETLRENILLGAPMDEAWYQRVLAACALLPDLKILPGGDMTQIGEKGINLSD